MTLIAHISSVNPDDMMPSADLGPFAGAVPYLIAIAVVEVLLLGIIYAVRVVHNRGWITYEPSPSLLPLVAAAFVAGFATYLYP